MISTIRFMLICVIVLFAVGCGNTPTTTPTPLPHLPASVTLTNNTCGDILTVSLRNLTLHGSSKDDIQDLGSSNQVQALIFLTDGKNATEFNYHVSPLKAAVDRPIELGRFHSAIDVSAQTPVYVWILVVDNDDPSILEQITEQAGGSVIGMLLGLGISASGGGAAIGLAGDFIWNMVSGAATDYIEQEDIIGDLAFTINAAENWNVGRYTVDSPNQKVGLDFEINRYSNCQQILNAPVASQPDTSAIVPVASEPMLLACNAATPRTRLQKGDMVVSHVQIFFREGPAQSYDGVRFDPGHMMRVIGPSTCDGDIMYWKVMSPFGVEGWMAESLIDKATQGGVYLLFPLGTSF